MISLLVNAIAPLLDKVIPDKDEANRLAHEIATLTERQAHEIAKAQANINQVEAAHKSLFVSGWRPATGWICAVSLGFNFLCVPIFNMVGSITGIDVSNVKPLDLEIMLPVLLGMLGLGGMRSYEKKNGVARSK